MEHALTELDTGNYGMILRSKGIVDGGADGWLEFDYVPGEWEVRSRSADVGGKLVVIGSNLNETAIAQLFGCGPLQSMPDGIASSPKRGAYH